MQPCLNFKPIRSLAAALLLWAGSSQAQTPDTVDRLTQQWLATEQQASALMSELAQQMAQVESVYQHPADYESQVQQKHKEIEEKLEKTRAYIARLEPVMRDIVNKELNKHEDRMGYYLAQSRLAKARLYDSTLLELERAQGDGASGTKAKSNGEQVK